MLIPNPCNFGFTMVPSAAGVFYRRRMGPGWLVLEVNRNEYIQYYSATGIVKAYNRLDVKPIKGLLQYLSGVEAFFKNYAKEVNSETKATGSTT